MSQPATRFRLLNVGVEEFTWLADGGSAADLNDLDAGFGFEIASADHRVGVAPRFTFRSGEQPVLVIQPLLWFEIHEEDWPVLREDNEIVLPAGLLQHLAVIAVGFTRGVLHEKVQQRPGYEQLMLPIVPVVELVTEAMRFAVADN